MKKILTVIVVIAVVVFFAALATYKVYDSGKLDIKKITTTIHQDSCDVKTQLRRIPIRTCNGEGELYLYETDNPFDPIQTSFEIERNQLLIFTSKDTQVWAKADGDSVDLETLSFTSGRVRIARSIEKDSKVCITGEYKNGIRGLQGFIAQDSTRPVYDINTFRYIYDDQESSEMFLTPGEYSYVFFDKYSLNGPGQGADNRKLSVKVEGPDGVVVDKTYTKPAPIGTEGAVVGNYSISQQGNYTLSVDSEDSIYWALISCPVCGNDKQEKGEDCDEGDNNGEVCDAAYGDDCFYCSDNCEYVTEKGPFCGDGNEDQGYEECDDGAQNGVPCTPAYGGTCTYCTSTCEEETVSGSSCGDGNLDQGEQCDDGNNIDNDGCSADCQLPDNCSDRCVESIGCDGGFVCTDGFCRNSACGDEVDCICATCGDGELDAGEQCDDGNVINGDGCNVDCTKPDGCNDVCISSIGCDDGLGCFSGVCRNTSCSGEIDCTCISCGDGNLDPGEQCDDGNNTNGDGCSASCRIEEDDEEDEDEEEDEEKKGDCDGSIGNYIWNDRDVDGVQDENEPGIDDVEVCAHDGNDKFCDKTNDQGRYKIKDLCAGTYDVRVRTLDLPGYVQTYDPDGKKDNKTDVKLRGDNDHHTKADFGYAVSRVAPSTGLGTVVLLVISALLTLFTIMTYTFFKRKELI